MSRLVKASVIAALTASLAVIGLPFGGGATPNIGTGCCTMY